MNADGKIVSRMKTQPACIAGTVDGTDTVWVVVGDKLQRLDASGKPIVESPLNRIVNAADLVAF